ncbi:MAG TPA: hypothetical protein VKS60_17460 [Stellaceae bacterium]|nr:hypothetical protein [Stellaceae bacterium]
MHAGEHSKSKFSIACRLGLAIAVVVLGLGYAGTAARADDSSDNSSSGAITIEPDSWMINPP